MRRDFMIFLLCMVMFVLFGCAAVKSTVSDYERCKGDAACLARMQLSHDVAEAGVKPFDFNGYIVQSVGMLASLLTGLIYGRKVGKQNV